MSKNLAVILTGIKKIEEVLSARLGENKLASYNTGRKRHKKQIAFHKCKKRNRWVFGGNRSGKTECGAVEAVYMARGIHPYRKNRKDVFGWVVSVSREVQRDVAQKKILSYLNPSWIEDITMISGSRGSPEYGIIDQIRIKNVFGGISVIGFKSCDQGREKFQGSSLDFVWFDEEPPEDIYYECRMRVLDKKGDIFGTMTPLKGLTFIYREIYLNEKNDKNVWYEFMEWADNPYLSKKEYTELSSALSSSELESRRFGRFKQSEGLVYPEFDENVHVVRPFYIPKDFQDMISIDPGLNNPLGALWFAVDFDDTVIVVAEHFEAQKDIAYHSAAIKKISDFLGWKTDKYGRIEALIDSAANQHTLAASKSVTELFFEHGIAVNPKVNKDMFAGIARVKEYFSLGKITGADDDLAADTSGNAVGEYAKIKKSQKPRILIFDNCVNLIRELKTYRFGGGDSPIKSDDHLLDALRYYLMTRPSKRAIKAEKTIIEKDKERLYKKIRYERTKKTVGNQKSHRI